MKGNSINSEFLESYISMISNIFSWKFVLALLITEFIISIIVFLCFLPMIIKKTKQRKEQNKEEKTKIKNKNLLTDLYNKKINNK